MVNQTFFFGQILEKTSEFKFKLAKDSIWTATPYLKAIVESNMRLVKMQNITPAKSRKQSIFLATSLMHA